VSAEVQSSSSRNMGLFSPGVTVVLTTETEDEVYSPVKSNIRQWHSIVTTIS